MSAVPTLADRTNSLGTSAGTLEVRLSTQLIHLLSEQMYSSPLKAVEELVVNSYDADADECRIGIELDPDGDRSFIAIFDDGSGMDISGLRELWHVGASKKLAQGESGRKHRKLIGKFGIGKLATYAIANRITYLSRQHGDVYLVTCDYRDFKSAPEGGSPEAVPLGVNRVQNFSELRDEEAFTRVCAALQVDTAGLLNGKFDTWTICLLEELKEKAKQIKVGRLTWVIRTALPLRSDFQVFLNGDEVRSSKEDVDWVVEFPPSDISDYRLKSLNTKWKTDLRRGDNGSLVGSLFPSGISGQIRVARKSLMSGKSADLGRSHGFFVRVRDRLLNEDDPLFGRNPLAHGTFNFFRADLNIDDLNEEVTASRENIEAGLKRQVLEDLLAALFYEARDKEEVALAAAARREARKRDGERSYVAPRLVEHPIAGVLATGPGGTVGSDADEEWFYIEDVEQAEIAEVVEKLYEKRSGYRYEYVNMGAGARMVKFDPTSSRFRLNDDHPLVKANSSEPKAQTLLEHLATAEVLLEVYMRESGIDPAIVGDILERRNTLLSSLARDRVYSLKQVADLLRLSRDDEHDLEINLVGALRALGFNAKQISGPGEPDGLARFNNYTEGERKITLEAKSSADVPQLGALDFATLNRHRESYGAEGCLLVAPAYPAFDDPNGAVSTNAVQQEVSCWLVEDLAQLVESAERLQISATDIMDIVSSRFAPRDVRAAVEALLTRKDSRRLYSAAFDALRQVFSASFLEEGDPRTLDHVAAVLSSAGTRVGRKEVKNALLDMASSSQGLLKVYRDRLILSGELDELERRIAPVTGRLGPPRQSGTFRSDDGS